MKNIRNLSTRRSVATIQKQLHEAALAFAEMHSGELFEPKSNSRIQEMILSTVRGIQAQTVVIDALLKATDPNPPDRKLTFSSKDVITVQIENRL